MNIEFPAGLWGGIAVYENAVNPETCKQVDDLLAQHWDALWEAGVLAEGKSMLGVNPAVKNSSDFELSPKMGELYERENGWFEDEIQASLGKCINHYVSQYDGLAGYCWPLGDTGFQVQRYEEGHGFYTEHIDGGPFGETKSRFLAALIYLNDVDEGGETTFTKSGLKIKPEAGKVLIFPSHWLYPHRGEIPLSGHKTIITTFVEQMETE
jgi:hypothetical protein